MGVDWGPREPYEGWREAVSLSTTCMVPQQHHGSTSFLKRTFETCYCSTHQRDMSSLQWTCFVPVHIFVLQSLIIKQREAHRVGCSGVYSSVLRPSALLNLLRSQAVDNRFLEPSTGDNFKLNWAIELSCCVLANESSGLTVSPLPHRVPPIPFDLT